MGYSVDLLREIHHLGRAVVGDDKLYEASQTYADPKRGSGIFGPALTASDSSKPIPAEVLKASKIRTKAINDDPESDKKNLSTDKTNDTLGIGYQEAKKILKDAGIEVAHNARKEVVAELLANYQATLEQ